MVSHFHYDPVWWNTQASYTTDWDFVGPDWSTRPAFVDNGFALVEAHLKLAVRDPDYHFVLAELDYLKPYFDTYPEQRAVLRRLLAEGRVELVGGTYNEPNTNLTSSETTIRNFVYGIGFQRDILGGDPQIGLAAGRVRPRPAVPRARRQGRADRQRVGARAAPPVGAAPPALGPGPDRRRHGHAVRERVRVDLAERRRRAHALHAGPLRPGLGAAARAVGRGRRRHRVPPLPGAETRCGDPEHAAAGRRRLLPSEQLGDRAAPVVERALRVAEVRLRDHAACSSTGSATGLAEQRRTPVAAEPRHEPGLHRQGRLLHRHQAGAARRGDGRHRRREADDVRRPARARAGTRRPPSTRCGGSSRSARTTTRSPAPRPTRSTSTCSPAGARRTTSRRRRARRPRRRRSSGASTPAATVRPSSCSTRSRSTAPTWCGRRSIRRAAFALIDDRGARGPGRRGGAGRRPVRRSGRPLDGMADLPRPRRWTAPRAGPTSRSTRVW